MATKRQVETKLRELIRRLNGSHGDVQGSLSESLPDGRTIEVVVPDAGAIFWTDLNDGRIGKLQSGPATKADIRIRVSSDHLVELVDGRASLFSSYIGGKVKIEASFADLLRLRRFV